MPGVSILLLSTQSGFSECQNSKSKAQFGLHNSNFCQLYLDSKIEGG